MGKGLRFGEYLRETRLRAGYGLRSFAEAIEMQPSNLSNIEHGRIPPPQQSAILDRIADALGLVEGSEERRRLLDLAVAHKKGALPPDVTEFVSRTPGIPILLRTIEDRRLSGKDLERLGSYIERHYRKGRR